jgi:hypothetical protein
MPHRIKTLPPECVFFRKKRFFAEKQFAFASERDTVYGIRKKPQNNRKLTVFMNALAGSEGIQSRCRDLRESSEIGVSCIRVFSWKETDAK